MKNIIILLLVIGLAIYWVACQQATSPEHTTHLLAPKAFQEKLAEKSNAYIIDVRTPEEFQAGHIDKATNINFYEDDFAEQMQKLDKNRPVFVYCKSGGRSGKTYQLLERMEYKEVYDLAGGYSAWKKSM